MLCLSFRQLKGEFCPQDEAVVSIPGDVELSEAVDGDPEAEDGVFRCMPLWTIDHELLKFLASLMLTVWTYSPILL